MQEKECTFRPHINPIRYNKSKEKANAVMKESNQKINKGISMIKGH